MAIPTMYLLSIITKGDKMFKLKRAPTHPAVILKEEFLIPLKITQTKLAQDLNVSFRAINELINQKRGITPAMALKLARYFNTTPQLWLNLQNEYELYKKNQELQETIDKITPFKNNTIKNAQI
jgi:addiction module HigA family antidote